MTLLVLVACATVIAAVPAFAATTNQVSITGLAGALSASDDLPPDPWMFTEGRDFDPYPNERRRVLDAEDRPVYLDFSRQPVSYYNGDFFRVDWETGDEIVALPDEIWGPAYEFPSDGNQYTFEDEPLSGFELRGRGPHGGYTTTSAKCAVCHSAHTAAAGDSAFDRGGEITTDPGPGVLQPRGYALLRQGSTGCEYCHLTGSPIGAAGMSSRIVYTSGSDIDGLSNLQPYSGHSIGFYGEIPRSVDPRCLEGECVNPSCANPCSLSMENRPLTCSTCHAVHGNIGTWQPLEFFRGDVDFVDSVTYALATTDEERELARFEDEGAHGNNETVRMLGYRMLRLNPSPDRLGNPAEVGVDGEYPDCFATSQDQINQFTMNEWCSSCHNDPNMLVPMEYTLRSIGADVTWTFEQFQEFYDNRMTAFTLNSSDVHSDEPFAHDYDDPTAEASAPHVTSFEGVYSGPGQCYTCHRGDLGGPLGEGWRFVNGEVFFPDPEDPADLVKIAELLDSIPLTGPESFARLRALGYFLLLDDDLIALIDPNDPVATQEAIEKMEERQARNLSCSGCHGFGTADYAFWSPRSDWPHSSPSTDRMLLGMNLETEDYEALDYENTLPEDRTAIIAQNFCARCHYSIPDESDPDQPSGNFLISRHFRDHIANVGNSGSMGTLGTLSPGNPQNNSSAP